MWLDLLNESYVRISLFSAICFFVYYLSVFLLGVLLILLISWIVELAIHNSTRHESLIVPQNSTVTA